MWVIKKKFYENQCYLGGMNELPSGRIVPVFYDLVSAFRFPDENTAFAVLASLNRDNLEVTCIE